MTGGDYASACTGHSPLRAGLTNRQAELVLAAVLSNPKFKENFAYFEKRPHFRSPPTTCTLPHCWASLPVMGEAEQESKRQCLGLEAEIDWNPELLVKLHSEACRLAQLEYYGETFRFRDLDEGCDVELEHIKKALLSLFSSEYAYLKNAHRFEQETNLLSPGIRLWYTVMEEYKNEGMLTPVLLGGSCPPGWTLRQNS
jgi:hypothetical protein